MFCSACVHSATVDVFVPFFLHFHTNACGYSLYTLEALNKIVLDAVNQLHSTTLSTLTNMHSLFTRAWGMYTMCTLVAMAVKWHDRR